MAHRLHSSVVATLSLLALAARNPATASALPWQSTKGGTPPATGSEAGAAPALPPAPAPLPAPEGLPPISSPSIEAASRERLARSFTTLAGKQIRKDQLAVADLELSLILAETAVENDPSNVWAWRSLYWIAAANDPADDRVQELRRKALDRIVRLDPTDEVMRLRRIVDLIEEEETVDGRIAKYHALLTKENRAILGDQISARLALDLALLLQRSGDQTGFETWLVEAVTLDPAFPAATSIAAGYFRFASEDPAQEAELLMSAMLANPLDEIAMRAFATVLLENGAYAGADRFLGLCTRREHTEYPLIAYDEVLGEYALAQLANRDYAGVDLTVRTRQQELDEYMRVEMTRADPTILGDAARMAALRFPVQPQQAAIRMAALRSLGNAEEIAAGVEALFRSMDSAVERATTAVTEAKTDEARIAAKATEAGVLLESAFLGVWLGENPEKARAFLTAADARVPLSEVAKGRFAAWETLRKGDARAALAAFEALNDDSPLAMLGHAVALDAVGNKRDAAKELLALARETPGTLVGVDAKRRLESLLGAPLPPDDLAAAVEAVADQVSPLFDRMFLPNARVARLRLRRTESPRNVYDQMPITIEITNESPIPLAIDPAGPLRDIISAEMTVLAAGQQSAVDMPPFMIHYPRRFSVKPNETLSIPFDIAYTDAGALAMSHAIAGCGISLHAILNWEAAIGGVRHGVFGDDADLGIVRIDGFPLTSEWIDHALLTLVEPHEPDDLVEIAALVAAASAAEKSPTSFDEEFRQKLSNVWPGLRSLMTRVGPATQAWLITILPDPSPLLDQALEPVRTAEDRNVRLAYLVRRATRSNDPVVDAAMRSEDATIARYGRLVKDMLFNEEEKLRRDFNIGGGAGGAGRTGQPPSPGAATPPPGGASPQPSSPSNPPTPASPSPPPTKP